MNSCAPPPLIMVALRSDLGLNVVADPPLCSVSACARVLARASSACACDCVRAIARAVACAHACAC
eukprot:6976848-Alexandrium_andersonii.AAC.1